MSIRRATACFLIVAFLCEVKSEEQVGVCDFDIPDDVDQLQAKARACDSMIQDGVYQNVITYWQLATLLEAIVERGHISEEFNLDRALLVWREASRKWPDFKKVSRQHNLLARRLHRRQCWIEEDSVNCSGISPTLPVGPSRLSFDQMRTFLHQDHAKIHGYLSSGATYMILKLTSLQRDFGINGSIGETGTFHGKLFALLALLASDEVHRHKQFFACDLFENQELNFGVGREFPPGVQSLASALTLAHTAMESVHVSVGSSLDIATDYFKSACIMPFRMFSVDGGPGKVALHDLELATSWLSEGGVVIYHGIFHNEFWTVTEPLLQYVQQKHALAPFAFIGNKVFLTTESYHDRYYTKLAADPFLSSIHWTTGGEHNHWRLAGHMLNLHLRHKVLWYNIDWNLVPPDVVDSALQALLET